MVRREKKPASKAAARGGARSVVSNYGVLAASVKTLSCGTKPESTVTPDGKRTKSSASHQPKANLYGYTLFFCEGDGTTLMSRRSKQPRPCCLSN